MQSTNDEQTTYKNMQSTDDEQPTILALCILSHRIITAPEQPVPAGVATDSLMRASLQGPLWILRGLGLGLGFKHQKWVKEREVTKYLNGTPIDRNVCCVVAAEESVVAAKDTGVAADQKAECRVLRIAIFAMHAPAHPIQRPRECTSHRLVRSR